MNISPMPLRPFSIDNRHRHSGLSLRPFASSAPWRFALISLFLVALALLVHCAPGVATVPPRARIAPAALQPSAIPSIEESRRLAAQADIHGSTAAGRVSSAKSGLADVSAANQSLIAEVDRLHKLKSATENDLLLLYNRLVEQERKFAIMVSDLTSAENELAAARALRIKQSEETIKVQQLVIAKEGEAAQLRSQLAQAALDLDAAVTRAEENAKLSAANAAKANQSSGTISTLYRVIFIGGILLLLSAGLNIVQLKT
jgi:hypothetical protein